MTVVSWRYLWQTTVLHRTEHDTEFGRTEGPPLPDHAMDAEVLTPSDGAGPHFHRLFRVFIAEAELDAAGLMRAVQHDFGSFVPREVVAVQEPTERSGGLSAGDEFVVDMPGPWNGPVRVVEVRPCRLRLATLRGHLEAGQIEFRTEDVDGLVALEIEAWARPSSKVVDLLYSRVRLAKEIQLNMWVRFCRAAVRMAGGRPYDGIEIHTYRRAAG